MASNLGETTACFRARLRGVSRGVERQREIGSITNNIEKSLRDPSQGMV
jgi:hypothetical protein